VDPLQIVYCGRQQSFPNFFILTKHVAATLHKSSEVGLLVLKHLFTNSMQRIGLLTHVNYNFHPYDSLTKYLCVPKNRSTGY